MKTDDMLQPLDERKINRLKLDILRLERDNLNTPDPDITDKIRKLIEEEVKKCY